MGVTLVMLMAPLEADKCYYTNFKMDEAAVNDLLAGSHPPLADAP